MTLFYMQEFSQSDSTFVITATFEAPNKAHAQHQATAEGYHPTGFYTRKEIEDGEDDDLKEQLEAFDLSE